MLEVVHARVCVCVRACVPVVGEIFIGAKWDLFSLQLFQYMSKWEAFQIVASKTAKKFKKESEGDRTKYKSDL